MADNNSLVNWEGLKYYDSKMDEVIKDIHNKLDTGGYTIDSVLSETSVNPVQNKVITEALETKVNKDDIPTSLPANGGNAATVNGKTVESDVPADAKFTDTVYTHPNGTAKTGNPTANQTPAFGGTFTVTQFTSNETGHISGATDRTIKIPNTVASTTAAGLMSAADKTKLDSTNIVYGTCATAAATAAKVVAITDNTNWKLAVGSEIVVKFTNTNTASSCTLNVNNTGAKQIWYNNVVYTGNSSTVCGYANRYIKFMYDGTYWVWMGHSLDLNTWTAASATVNGYVTTGAQTFAGNKTFNGVVAFNGASAVGTAQGRNIYAGTSDMTAGTTALETGSIYLVYE